MFVSSYVLVAKICNILKQLNKEVLFRVYCSIFRDISNKYIVTNDINILRSKIFNYKLIYNKPAI